jgi:dTDP-4-amino-4,6-dideoxygalactose transaminase
MSNLALFGGERAVPALAPPSPALDEATISALHRAVEHARTDWSYLSAIGGGGPVGELEQAACSHLGARHALATSSGTAALFTALLVAGIGAGDEVIVPAYSWGQSVGPVLHVGARPVFADIDPLAATLAPDDVARRITSRTGAIVVAHLYGQPADMEAICRTARRHRIAVIEDCAQAMGARSGGASVGTFGTIACFSLGRQKPVSGGEGGLLVTNDRRLYDRALRMTQHPIRQRHELGGETTEFGYNFRIHPLAAVVALAQFASLEERVAARHEFCVRLSNAVEGIPGIIPVRARKGTTHAWYRYCPSVDPEQLGGGDVSRERFIEALLAEGVPIGPDPIAVPLHRRSMRPFMDDEQKPSDCPAADRRCRETGLALASWVLDVGERAVVDSIAGALRKVVDHLDELAPARTQAGAVHTSPRGIRLQADFVGDWPRGRRWPMSGQNACGRLNK